MMAGRHKSEWLMLEPYRSGTFHKFINNDGQIDPTGEALDAGVGYVELAEALTHFSYQHSNKELLLLDVQGFGLELTDPEVASCAEGESLFCIGNFGKEGFSLFFSFSSMHVCNKFCEALKLESVDSNLFSKQDL